MSVSGIVLRVLSYVVPAHERADWIREWEAEITYAWHSNRLRGPANELLERGGDTPELPARISRVTIALRCCGALEDAFWLRIRRRDNTMVLQDIRYAIRTLAKNPHPSVS